MAKSADPRKTNAYKALRQSIRDDLDAAGKVSRIHDDMLDLYMSLWVDLQNFQTDIARRGVVVMDEKRGQLVENRSVSLKLQVAREMRAVYAELTKPDPGSGGGEDDEL